MAHPVMFRYLSYSTALAEHAVHRLRQCPAFGQAGARLFLSVCEMTPDLLGWPHDHGPTNGPWVHKQKIYGAKGR